MDYHEVMKIDPTNAEYQKFFDKAAAKYEETEGHPLSVASLSISSTVTSTTTVSDNASSSNSTAHSLQLKSVNQISKSQSAIIVESISVNQIDDLLIPTVTVDSLSMGIMTENTIPIAEEKEDEVEEFVNEELIKEQFVKIPIQIEDDDDDEEEEDEGEEGPNHAANNSSDRGSSFVRIPIVEEEEEEEEDSDDNDEAADETPADASIPPLTPILDPIEQQAGIDTSLPLEQKALLLKEYGNSCMLKSDFDSALKAYSLSLQYNHNILTLNNRAQAKLSLKVSFMVY
jgi:hypothetical protein